jgi:hypothetical protein
VSAHYFGAEIGAAVVDNPHPAEAPQVVLFFPEEWSGRRIAASVHAKPPALVMNES